MEAYSSQVVGPKDKRGFANALVVKKEKDYTSVGTRFVQHGQMLASQEG